MGEKVEKKNKAEGAGEKMKKGGAKDNGGGGGKKDGAGPTTVVLKVDMHCEGCALKVKKAVKGFPGVEAVSTDMANNKITVVGNVDPLAIRERLETKTRKKVDLISPVPKDSAPKESESNKPKPDKAKEEKKPDDKKPKPPSSSTVVLKIPLHCDGCIQRIRKSILKFKGVENVNIDSQKNLVSVKGTMDINSLASYLKEKLRRSVEIVTEKKVDGSGEKKEKSDSGGDGDVKKGKGGDGGGGDNKKEDSDHGENKQAAAVAVEGNKMEYYGPYGYSGNYGNAGGYSYDNGNGNGIGQYRMEMVHAPQIFSDENPNACSIM